MMVPDNPYSMVVIGDGWRGEFFCRVAQAVPQWLQVSAVVGHHSDRLERLAKTYGVRVGADMAVLDEVPSDFVSVAVSWSATPGLAVDLAKRGKYVLCETPPAPDMEGLRRLWDETHDCRELIQIGEQYYRMPGHASRLAVLRQGALSTVNSVQIASTHLYHAVSLMRCYLGIGRVAATVNARVFTSPMINPLQRDGWTVDPEPEPIASTLATVDFGDGRYGVYDFVDNQWWNPLLSRRVVVRASLGEMVDDTVLRWVDGTPVTSHIEYRRLGRDMNLEGNEVASASFDGNVVYRNPLPGGRLSEDDLAVADHLVAMGRYARGEGDAIYSLADGMHDHAIGLAIEASVRSGQDVRVEDEPWMA